MSEVETSRATEALDRLIREQSRRRRLFARRPDPIFDDEPTPTGPPLPPRRLLIAGGVVAVLVVVAALLVTQRRPPPIDDRLPVADASAAASPGASPTPTSPEGLTAGPAAGAGGSTADDASGSSTSVPVGDLVVHVAGAVSAPGVVEVRSGGRVVDAVRAAGGLRADADPDRVNLAAPLTDGQRIVIPVLGQEPPAEVAPVQLPGDPSDPGATGAGGSGPATSGPIDLNSADAAQLDELPGVGPSTAAAILEHREREGPFRSVDGLLDVRGIGEAKLEALRDLVTVGG